MRPFLLALLAFAIPGPVCAQPLSVLRVTVALADADGKSTPIPRHALLISDNPATITPRQVVTGPDGTVEVRLRPGNYTVESDHPVVFLGKSYQWTRTLDIAAGRDAVLDLTATNAEVDTVAASAAVETDPWVALQKWEESVFALWSPLTRASGFVTDAKGLIVTTQRAVGTAPSMDVQVTPAIKVAATVLAADAARDVAVLWIDPTIVRSIRPIPIACPQPAPAVASGDDIFTIGVPMRQPKGLSPGTLASVDAKGIVADMRLSPGSAGGPVFTPEGAVIGITSRFDEKDERSRTGSPIVRVADVCSVVAAAEKKMESAARPSATHLPVEPAWPLPEDAFKEAAQRRAGGLGPYQMASANFDVSFITPVMTYGTRYQAEVAGRARSGGATRNAAPQKILVRPAMDFGNWSEYVDGYPPVLLVRITPKMVEGFWTTMARGAAQTQGVAIPAMKHFGSGFVRLRALCGDAEVTPVHALKIEHRVSATDTVYEGLYVFDPGAFGPQCATVTLVLYAEKEPEKADTRVVDPRLLQQIADDFALYHVPNR